MNEFFLLFFYKFHPLVALATAPKIGVPAEAASMNLLLLSLQVLVFCIVGESVVQKSQLKEKSVVKKGKIILYHIIPVYSIESFCYSL